MPEFSIVHLSDLHIKADKQILSRTLSNLLEDIKNRTIDMNTLILVVTGDIVDRGNFGNLGNKDTADDIDSCKNPALDFFHKLHEILGHRVIDIQMCPGNHDKDMSNKSIQWLAKKIQKNGLSEDMSSENLYHSQSQCFENYIHFANKVYRIFDLKKGMNRSADIKVYKSPTYTPPNVPIEKTCELSPDNKRIDCTFGVDFLELPCMRVLYENRARNYSIQSGIGNECKDCKSEKKHAELSICFLKMNTAWTSHGEPEEHELLVGEYQLKTLMERYSEEYEAKRRDKQPIITICISHHPLMYLKPHEEDEVKNALLDDEKLNVDFHLCGHTHVRSLSSTSKKGKRLTTLSTGIGWDHDNDKEKDTHSYSIYTFDEEKNVLSSTMLRTNTADEFRVDHSYHSADSTHRISEPLYFDRFSFIKLNAFNDSVMNELYVDDFVLEQIGNLMEERIVFEKNSEKLFEKYVYNDLKGLKGNSRQSQKKIIDNILTSTNPLSSGTKDTIKRFIDQKYPKGEHTRDLLLFEFLSELLSKLEKNLENIFYDDDIRIIVRGHDEEMDLYRPIDGLILCNEKGRSGYKNPNFGKRIDREYPWILDEKKQITALSFKKNPRIYTLNKKAVTFPVDNWKDFMVVTTNEFKYRYKRHTSIDAERPILSFVFSVRLNKEMLKKLNFSYPQDRFVHKREKFKDLCRKLYLLEYIGISKSISSAIDRFIDYYRIKPEIFLQYLRTSKKYLYPCKSCKEKKFYHQRKLTRKFVPAQKFRMTRVKAK